ncbi:MAG: rhomboid family intramembrane serine protease [Deltaproteobacteria bacterium]|nr:rhomboid family intramembrane serine protease [Deltaproteobacteria bacterium]
MRTATAQFNFPRPGKALLGLMITLVVCYVGELVGLRAGLPVDALWLSPQAVFEQGAVWQLVTYLFQHSPTAPGHLFMNLLWLYFFGARMEQHWGPKRFLILALVFGVAGGVLTLLVGLASTWAPLGELLPGFWVRPHLGVSGAAMGIVIAYGLTFAHQQMQLLLLGAISGRTLVIGVVIIELISALSLDQVSSTAHFGGMIAAFVYVRGFSGLRRVRLETKRKRLEHELQVIQGGKSAPPSKLPSSNPKDWN